jgi:NAD(P)-dependent dehydrogenase (short-subunit alcohol dehydrogenase family)
MEAPKYKTALIVGAGEGLSASLARLFARQGIRVALAARSVEKLGALCSETGARAYACNATDADEVERLFGLLEREIGNPDVVYNAGARARGTFVDLVPARPRDRRQRVRRLSGGPAGRETDVTQQAWRDPVHRRVRQHQGLPAIGAVRDGQVRTARAGAEHGA